MAMANRYVSGPFIEDAAAYRKSHSVRMVADVFFRISRSTPVFRSMLSALSEARKPNALLQTFIVFDELGRVSRYHPNLLC